MCSASSIARYQGICHPERSEGSRARLWGISSDISLDMWYCLSNNASMSKMFGYNLHSAKKQECLLNQAFEGRL
jgi:hypothetical protein